MATYSTLFVATDPQLDRAFPRWIKPRAVPVRVTLRNPFTRATATVDSWEPDGYDSEDETDREDVRESDDEVLAAEDADESADDVSVSDGLEDEEESSLGDVPPANIEAEMARSYPAYLNARVPDALRGLPYCASKNIDPVLLGRLTEILAGTSVEQLVPARFPPRSLRDATAMLTLPAELEAAVAQLSDGRIAECARGLAVDSEMVALRWGGEQDFAELLTQIRGLATHAAESRGRVILWMEW